MAPVSKAVLSISMLLTILLASMFSGCSAGWLSKVTVELTNKLPSKQLGVHCKDKDHDLGPQNLQVNQKWSFRFRPNPFWAKTLYFCHFYWAGGDHLFDIYVQKRDTDVGHYQAWDITETGPCRNVSEFRQCFRWNQDIGKGRQLGHENNIIGV